MNPFSNNRPRLTASEGIRNKRNKTIYQAEKQQFQSKRKCGNKNVKYYNNGTIRSMQSYKLQQSLARGNVLCEDCNDRGMLCGKITNKAALGSIHMGNNALSEYWGGAKVDQLIPTLEITQGWPVVTADVSGNWDPSGGDWKGDISANCTTDCSYGYVDNLIAIPRNLDGSGIVIDPSNILFPDELCDPFRYLQKSYLKTFLVVRGAVDLTNEQNAFPLGPGTGVGEGPSYCSDPSYNSVVGKQFVLANNQFPPENLIDGKIRSLCCIKEMEMIIKSGPGNADPPAPPYNAPPKTKTVGIFDMYVEVFYLDNDKMSFISKLINYKPQYYPDNIPSWTPLLPNQPPPVQTTIPCSGWDWLPLCKFVQPPATGDVCRFPFAAYINMDPTGIPGMNLYNYIESFKLIQGTIPPSSNQTKYNATRQSYMSCLEDGTRKINFTKNTKKNNTVKNAYCKVIVPLIPVVPPT